MKQFQTIGKTVEGNEGQKCNYPTRLDTFGCGCQHDCSYHNPDDCCNLRR